MAEIITKENDYTLKIEQQAEDSYENGAWAATRMHEKCTRIFNFAAGQLTTDRTSLIFQSRNNSAGGHSGVSKQVVIQNFTDIPCKIELELMHAKLVELGGKPPPLDDVLNGRNKRPLLPLRENTPGK